MSYSIENNTLRLKVKRAPLVMLIVLFTVSALFFISPIAVIIAILSLKAGFHLGFLIGVLVFGLGGFYLLRIALWNTFGEETLQLSPGKVTYEANYGWFVDSKKTLEWDEMHFEVSEVGYEEDHKGVLTLGDELNPLRCATKLDLDELKTLTEELNEKYSFPRDGEETDV